MHNLGPFAPTILGRTILSDVIHFLSLSSSFGKENFPTLVLHFITSENEYNFHFINILSGFDNLHLSRWWKVLLEISYSQF